MVRAQSLASHRTNLPPNAGPAMLMVGVIFGVFLQGEKRKRGAGMGDGFIPFSLLHSTPPLPLANKHHGVFVCVLIFDHFNFNDFGSISVWGSSSLSPHRPSHPATRSVPSR